MLVSAVTPDGFTVGADGGQDKLRMDEPAKMTDSIHIMLKMAIPYINDKIDMREVILYKLELEIEAVTSRDTGFQGGILRWRGGSVPDGRRHPAGGRSPPVHPPENSRP